MARTSKRPKDYSTRPQLEEGSDGFRWQGRCKKLAPIVYGINGAFKGDRRRRCRAICAGRDRPADPTLRLDGRLGQSSRRRSFRLRHEASLCQRRDALNLYFRSANTPTPNRDELEGQRNRQLLSKGLDRDRPGRAHRGLTPPSRRRCTTPPSGSPLFHEPLFVRRGRAPN